MLSYEMECVLRCADEYRMQTASERTPARKKADAWDAESDSYVKGCVLDIAAVKQSQDSEQMFDAIRSMEVVKLAVRNPDAGSVTDDWLREAVPEALDIRRQEVVRMIRRLFAPAGAYCLDDTEVRKVVFRIDSGSWKDTEFSTCTGCRKSSSASILTALEAGRHSGKRCRSGGIFSAKALTKRRITH